MRARIAAEVVVALAVAWAARGGDHGAIADFKRAIEADPRRAEDSLRKVAMELERDPNAKARSAALVAAIAQATSGFAAFEATVAGLGAFPTPTRPRVIWAGVGRGADALVGLAGRVDEALAALGFEREPRPFSPHATLGRVR